MLLTVTLNPAIDRILPVEGFTSGKIFRIPAANVQVGGKGLNVARAAHTLGLPVRATGPIAGAAGHYFAALATQEAFPSQWIQLTHGDTRTCTLIVHPPQDTTVINESGPNLTATDWQQLTNKLLKEAKSANLIAFSGSVSGVQPDGAAFAALIEQLIRHGHQIAIDTNRAPLKAILKHPLWLLKMNASELSEAIGQPLDSIAAITQAAQQVQHNGPQQLMVSAGAKGAILTTQQGTWRATPPQIDPISPVGAGDSTLAGYCTATLMHNTLPHEALRVAVATGTADVLTEAPGVVSVKIVNEIARQVRIEQVV